MGTPAPTHTLVLPDGRELEYALSGAEAGPLVIVHTGTPGAAVPPPWWQDPAHAAGLRLATLARAGYGRSTRLPGRRVSDAAADATALADSLGAERFCVYGFSGGGPHALACAALAPERVVACVLAASVAPYDAPGLDFLAGMGEGNLEEFGVAVTEGEAGLRPAAEASVAELLAAGPQRVAELMSPHIDEVDAALFAGEAGPWLYEVMRSGSGGGVDGLVDDDLVFIAPWGFDPAAVRVPVALWQGEHDRMVPAGHGAWLAATIPGAQAHLNPPDGHLSVIGERVGEQFAWLAEQAAAAGLS